ncbi:MAG: hypothetical protein ACQEXX_01335 [Bacillota bacterium]
MNENTWGLQFIKVDIDENKFDTMLALNIGDEEKTKELFYSFKSIFSENTGTPDCVIDLIDEDGSIIDDFPVTKNQATEIALSLRHKLN